MKKVFYSHEAPKIGDRVTVFLHSGDPKEIFETITGTLERLDYDYPSGCISGQEIDFASEGHSSFIRVIKE